MLSNFRQALKRQVILKNQLVQFIFVGSLNAVIDLGFLDISLLLYPTNNPTLLIIFNTAAYLLAIMNSYIWNSRFAFRNHAQKNLREKIYFFLQAGVSLIISNFVFLEGIHFLTLCRFSLWFIQSISKILAMVTPSMVSFLFMKYFVFRRKEQLSSPEGLTNS
ncbi:GtrA family protein [Desulfosporosinus sp. FKB]|uniref:GtrA family protein n=1 Tax=Desulfosporosinus sp. FKB TaxID=1969835 RepID=UPI000B49C0F0|nr:GtrA family protein [Desulfosporosinus sp. FKB]